VVVKWSQEAQVVTLEGQLETVVGVRLVDQKSLEDFLMFPKGKVEAVIHQGKVVGGANRSQVRKVMVGRGGLVIQEGPAI